MEMLLGVKIDLQTKEEAVKKVEVFLADQDQHTIFTPNPEMLVDAQTDSYFREVLNTSDLNVCDGKGIQLFLKNKTERIPGVDLLIDICSICQKEQKNIFLLGSGSSEVVQQTKKALEEKFPHLKIVGIHPGIPIAITEDKKIQFDEQENNDMIASIVESEPDVLFVAFGHGKQEKWIYQFLADMPSVKIAMGVGGSFDYISGKIKRAPKLLRRMGFEWLWRLIREPKRIKRIWKATFVFIIFYFKK